MSIDISKIPLETLRTDLRDTMADIGWCVVGLNEGLTHYGKSQRSLKGRFFGNLKIAKIILCELDHRGEDYDLPEKSEEEE